MPCFPLRKWEYEVVLRVDMKMRVDVEVLPKSSPTETVKDIINFHININSF